MSVVPVIDEHDNGNSAANVVGDARIVVRHMAGASVVRVVGDVDLAVAGRLRATFESALAMDPWIIVDLRRTEAVDSVGLGVLLAARQAARRRSGDLVLAAAPAYVVSVIRAARLGAVFPMFDTVPQAITYALRSPADHG
ncbi:STAS domain-containing protein [Actinoplanes xinjiangensis]|uniref:STAS domain-containing protein n=1 Tax=Actinoplanes xinjiangensis TaxID=512350 RepID=UPI003422DC32